MTHMNMRRTPRPKTRTIWLLELRCWGKLQGDGEFWPTRKACLDQLADLVSYDNPDAWEARITKLTIPNPLTGWRKGEQRL
jgi:hypothetical protein